MSEQPVAPVSSVGQAPTAVRPATLHAIARHLESRAVTILRPESEAYAEYNAVAALMRRMADETQPAEHQPRRGDRFEAWLKEQRDACFGHATTWGAVDGLLDRYRLHADTRTPLGQHVCEGQVVGDCECLEQPTAGARQDGAQS